MILAAVDDLLFSSKIRNVARRLGLDVIFARSMEAILERTRAERPSLVIVDLNGTSMRPVESIAAIRADPTLGRTRIVGFVSHVQVDLIEAARTAGADEVMARSAFTASLPDILSGSR
jgi:CheY-like chemotaxis protein